MKKKMIGLLLAGTMAAGLMAPALVYADETPETEMAGEPEALVVSSSSIEDGILTIYLEDDQKDNGFHWEYSREDESENSSVELLTDSTEEGYAYVGSFKAVDGVEDAQDWIRLIHTDGFMVDQYMDFDVKIEDGEITENIGGSHALPNTGENLAPLLEGTWKEALEGVTMMDISLGSNGGLDIVISDGSGKDGTTSFYTMTAYYDVIKNVLVYQNGTEHEDAVITDGSEEQTEADEQQGNGAGILELVAGEDGSSIAELHWTNSEGGAVSFVRE